MPIANACAAALTIAAGAPRALAPALILSLACLALWLSSRPGTRGFAFPTWVAAFVAWSLAYPATFGTWFGLDLKLLVVPLIQVIMFGMGTTLSSRDFTRVLTMPLPVLVGVFLQFTVMPSVGTAIAYCFGFEAEIAAGIILVGCVSGGVASNVMTYLAGGDVPLSVTMTACSTMLAPVLTPFLMQLLAGRLIPIDFAAMMIEILNMVIVPLVAGLVAHRILYGEGRALARAGPLLAIALASALLAAGSFWILAGGVRYGFVLGFALTAVVAGTKLIVNGIMGYRGNWMDRALPLVSMLGICFIIAIITARSSADLLSVGFALIGAAALHNLIGYALGYWLARAVGLDERTCRTVSIEVGMQNAGMASGLALSVLGSARTALAPAIFGPWMNVSGSILASWWRRRPISDDGGGKHDREEGDSHAKA